MSYLLLAYPLAGFDPPSGGRFWVPRDRKAKALRILAPNAIVEALGTGVILSSFTPDILLDKQSVELKERDGYWMAETKVEGRRLGATGMIAAYLGNMQARTRVTVVRRDSGLSLDFTVVDKDFGPWRAQWEGDLLKIAGRHPAIRRYLGPPPNFEGQKTPAFRLLLAEIVSAEVCRRVMEKKAEKRDLFLNLNRSNTDETQPLRDIYTEHTRLLSEFLPVAHEVMLSEAEARALMTQGAG